MVVRSLAPLISRSNQATRRGLLMAPTSPRSTPLTRRIAPISTSLALLALGLGLVCPAAGADGVGPKIAGALAIPGSASAAAPPASEVRESLSQSIQRRKDFPFTPLCDGNTQEMVACLWQRRDRSDLRLRKLLGNEQVVEHWRAARLAVCRRSSERGAGGSIQPLLWLGCENALNSTLLEQITGPLGR